MQRFPGWTRYTSPHGMVVVWSARAGSSNVLVIKAQCQGRRAFHMLRDERQHVGEIQLCRQQELVGMMEGGQEGPRGGRRGMVAGGSK